MSNVRVNNKIHNFGEILTLLSENGYNMFGHNVDLFSCEKQELLKHFLEKASNLIITYTDIKRVDDTIISRTIPITSLKQATKMIERQKGDK